MHHPGPLLVQVPAPENPGECAMIKFTWTKPGTIAIALTVMILGGCQSGGEEPASNSQTGPATSIPPPNNPPSISGVPLLTTLAAETYSFVPTASDPDDDTLSFSVLNMPVWASFDAATGELSGTPQSQHVGTYTDIGITVNDGEFDVALDAFSIDVVDVGIFSVTLSWTPPTQNTDESPLIDLAGYYIYYGLSAGNYPNRIAIDNPGIATFVVENLTPNTYYFVATSVNSSGVESEYSNVAIKVAG